MMRSQTVTVNPSLFQFAYISNWHALLDELAQMALPEPWQFRSADMTRGNSHTLILERYIHNVHRALAIEHQNAVTQEQKDAAFYMRGEFACCHTGLYDRRFRKPIYGFFARNKREGVTRDWVFRGFVSDASPLMRAVQPLPMKPYWHLKRDVLAYFSDYPIRVSLEHILLNQTSIERIPEPLRAFQNLPLLLQTAVEMARQQVADTTGMVVPQVFNGQVQFMMPLSLADESVTDLVLTLAPMDGYYMGSTCLTPEMAYGNARQLARPTAPWLTALVE